MLRTGFSPVPRLDAGDLPRGTDLCFPLKLGCAKTITYCHSQGRNIPSLRRLTPYPILEILSETAAARGIKMDDWLEITMKAGAFIARAKLDNNLAFI